MLIFSSYTFADYNITLKFVRKTQVASKLLANVLTVPKKIRLDSFCIRKLQQRHVKTQKQRQIYHRCFLPVSVRFATFDKKYKIVTRNLQNLQTQSMV